MNTMSPICGVIIETIMLSTMMTPKDLSDEGQKQGCEHEGRDNLGPLAQGWQCTLSSASALPLAATSQNSWSSRMTDRPNVRDEFSHDHCRHFHERRHRMRVVLKTRRAFKGVNVANDFDPLKWIAFGVTEVPDEQNCSEFTGVGRGQEGHAVHGA